MTPHLLPYTPDRDAYRLLGVPPTASTDEIHAACRRLARTFHPDRNRSGRATQEMQIVNVVRRVMTDPEERARYDWERRRFHQELIRPTVGQLHAWAPPHAPTPVPSPAPSAAAGPMRTPGAARSPAVRYLRAGLLGVRAAVAGLAPTRCRGCRIVIGPDDVYCAACGTPRLTGG